MSLSLKKNFQWIFITSIINILSPLGNPRHIIMAFLQGYQPTLSHSMLLAFAQVFFCMFLLQIPFVLIHSSESCIAVISSLRIFQFPFPLKIIAPFFVIGIYIDDKTIICKIIVSSLLNYLCLISKNLDLIHF